MAVKIAISNTKGGCGKTATTVSLAGELSMRGYRTLVIDADSSGNASSRLEHETSPETEFADMIVEYCRNQTEMDPRGAIVPTAFPKLDLMEGSTRLEVATRELQMLPAGSERVFSLLFADIEYDYDFILIDTLPERNGKLLLNALFYADFVLTPMQADQDSIDAFTKLQNLVHQLKRTAGLGADILGCFFTMVQPKKRAVHRELIEGGKELFDKDFITVHISDSADIVNARNQLMPICYYRSKSTPAKEYKALADEIIKRIREEI